MYSRIRTLPASQLFSHSSLMGNRQLPPQTRPKAYLTRWRKRTVHAVAQRRQESETRLIWRHTRLITTQTRHPTTRLRSSSPRHRRRATTHTRSLRPRRLQTAHPSGASKINWPSLLLAQTTKRRGMIMSRQMQNRKRPMLKGMVNQQLEQTVRRKTRRSSIISCI